MDKTLSIAKENISFIDPITENKDRPLWSVVIPTYNCADYLKETLRSVLKQDIDPGAMEIIVVDDCSTKDDPGQVVQEVGNSRVRFICQSKNVGKSRNYETGISESMGYYIHLLHGDDTINPGFYNKIESLFAKFPETGAAFCTCNYIDAHSEVTGNTGLESSLECILPDWKKKIAVWQRIQPPSIVFKREVYETIGGYDNRLKYLEDWEFYVRASLQYKFAYTPEILANYRIFDNNSSQRSIIKGKRIKPLNQAIQTINEYLPEKLKEKIKSERKTSYISYLLQFIPIHIRNKDLVGWIKTMNQIILKTPSLRLLLRGIKLTYSSLLSK